ncbi:hypothetical protein V757_08905 [Pelistega indica]|uniref:Uncharacterized protein n=1 Tax=Pelistega indica TaxID=1414851 RepID=V8FYW5_9BURK|nr:hypothetical protein V757_08905 [Pelistega indica]
MTNRVMGLGIDEGGMGKKGFFRKLNKINKGDDVDGVKRAMPILPDFDLFI